MSSSRRTTGEINILAMLDGRAAGRSLFSRPAVFWYGAAGILACSLLVVLAWLVRGTTPARDGEMGDAAQAVLHPAPAAVGTAAAAHDAATAVTHREDADAVHDSLQAAVPGTRTPPAGDAPSSSATARGAVVIDVAASATVPAPATATTPSAAPAPALAAASQAAHAPAPTGNAPVHSQPAPTRHPSVRPQPASQAPSLAHADGTPRQRRAASRTAPSSAALDTDVALISAILQHTGGRNEAADGAGAPACADKSCRPRLPSRQ